jgi:hypothetical protein
MMQFIIIDKIKTFDEDKDKQLDVGKKKNGSQEYSRIKKKK